MRHRPGRVAQRIKAESREAVSLEAETRKPVFRWTVPWMATFKWSQFIEAKCVWEEFRCKVSFLVRVPLHSFQGPSLVDWTMISK